MTTWCCCPLGKSGTKTEKKEEEEIGQQYENVEISQPDDKQTKDDGPTHLNYIQVEFSNKPSNTQRKVSVTKPSDSNGVTYSEVTVDSTTVYENS